MFEILVPILEEMLQNKKSNTHLIKDSCCFSTNQPTNRLILMRFVTNI